MDIKTISVALAIVTVSAVIFGALLPMFQDVTATEDTFTNEGYFFINEHNPTDEDVTIFWNHLDPDNIIVNDKTISLANIPYNRTVSVQMGPEMVLRYVHTATSGDIRVSGPASYICNTGNGRDMTVVLTSTGATVTSSHAPDTPATYNYDGTMYYINDTGPYIMKNADAPAYLKGDTDLFIVGTTSMFGQPVVIRIEGNLTEGFTPTTIKVGSDAFTVTYSPITAHSIIVGGYDDLYQLDKLTFTATNDNTSETYNVTYNYFMVPYEVTGERSAHVDGPTGAIINLIPLIVALSIVILAVGWFITRKL